MNMIWKGYKRILDADAVSRHNNIEPVIAEIVANRIGSWRTSNGNYEPLNDYDIKKYLYGDISETYNPSMLQGIDKAADLLLLSIHNGSKIRVIGDYDVDGMTSVYMLFIAIQFLGGDVSYDIPDRVQDGYGMNIRLVEKAIFDGVQTIITCDNGIAAFDAVKKAKNEGMTVIITDHHTVQNKLPDADAIINPHLDGDGYPFKEICGAMVAYKFINYVYEKEKIPLSDSDMYLSLAALATTCDVMPLVDENRIYVKKGLESILNISNIGMQALIKELKLDKNVKLKNSDFGFRIGPCMNTQGRLYSAKNMVNLLMEENKDRAAAAAKTIVEQNQNRKSETETYQKNFIKKLQGTNDKVVVEYAEGLHESLAGIVAGKVKEALYRPTIILTESAENTDIYKGSGRSIPAYNIFAELSKVSELMYEGRFGGHPLAAGLTIEKKNLKKLHDVLNANANITDEDMTPVLHIDAEIMPDKVTLKTAIEIEEKLGPFGNWNEEPVFAVKNVKVTGLYVNEKGSRIIVNTSGGTFISFSPEFVCDSIKKWFGEADCAKLLNGTVRENQIWINESANHVKLDIAYNASVNQFRGNQSMQYIIKDIRKSEED